MMPSVAMRAMPSVRLTREIRRVPDRWRGFINSIVPNHIYGTVSSHPIIPRNGGRLGGRRRRPILNVGLVRKSSQETING